MKGIWAVPIIFGIALMMGFSIIPVFASMPDLYCGAADVNGFAHCSSHPILGDHVQVVLNDPRSVCHGDITEVDTRVPRFKVTITDGPNCADSLIGAEKIINFKPARN
ncbi:MAG TPA: hypothetical protein VFG25_05075 [Nitrosopumilaceae archaeon]|nr:hypothetical protein [Nitrosopumilaceae archaeon]